MKINEITENELEHGEALIQSGGQYWGKRGSGIVPFAQDTQEFCFAFRSKNVHPPSVYGSFGGAIDSNESFEKAAEREFQEETKFNGNIKLIGLPVWQAPNFDFAYKTFIGIIPEKFTPKLNWENENYVWVEPFDWPNPMIQGLKETLNKNEAIEIINKIF